MSESEIRTTAQAHGLEVLKRITTGSEKRHFATFELSGDPAKGAPYIEIDSVWCEV